MLYGKETILLDAKNLLSEVNSVQSFSVFFLIGNLLLMVTILLLLNSRYLPAAAIISGIYIGFCIWKYKNSLKRLKKISFWISFIVITFAAAFLWNGFSHGAFFSKDGLMIGLKMNARAIVLMIGFASISVELKNPVIKSLLYNKGFASLYQSLNLAFSALPYFISNLSKKAKDKPEKSLRSILSQAGNLLEIFQNEHQSRPKVIIITGEIQQGKTTFVRKIIADLIEEKYKIAGFLSLGIETNGIRTGFDIFDIKTSEKIELCSDIQYETKIKLGHYYFNSDAIVFGNKILSPERIDGMQLIVIDEIGPLELKGQGWSNSIEELTGKYTIPQLWVVRKKLVEKISSRWNIGDAFVFDIADSKVMDVEKKIKELINAH